jgi:hypothetical protein
MMAFECLAIDSVFADLVLDLPLGNAKLPRGPALVPARVPESVLYNIVFERRQYLVQIFLCSVYHSAPRKNKIQYEKSKGHATGELWQNLPI